MRKPSPHPVKKTHVFTAVYLPRETRRRLRARARAAGYRTLGPWLRWHLEELAKTA